MKEITYTIKVWQKNKDSIKISSEVKGEDISVIFAFKEGEAEDFRVYKDKKVFKKK